MNRNLEPISRKRATLSPHHMARMILKIQRHLGASHPDHHPSLLQGNLTTLRLSIAWKYRWSPTKDERAAPPSSHPWQVPIAEGMVWDGKVGLTEAIVTGPGQTILFYGWQSLEEGMSLGNTWHTTFTLSGNISKVGKQAQLSAKLASVGDGQQLIDPSHHWKTHWTKRTWLSLFNTTCFNTIQFS